MATKRKSPLEIAAERMKSAMATADSVMMSRMPKSFQEIHKRRKEKPKEK